MPAGTAYLVLEMGMNAPGEIAYLTSITPPDVGVITCIAPVHLEGLGTLEAVAAAKAELLHGLRAGGWAVLPGQEPLLAPHIGAIPLDRRLHFGVSEEDDVRLARVDAQGTAGSRVVLALRDRELAFHLPVVGAHHAANAAAAVAVGLVLGVDDAQIIEALEDPPAGLGHRSTLRALGSWHLLDDCYNASPLSMRAALDTLGQLAGSDHRAAVLGMMAELGDETEAYHLEIGAHAAASGLDLLVVVDSPAIARGAREGGMPGARLIEVADAAAAADELVRRAGPGAWVLVKGSRRVQLERTIERLETLVGGEGDPEAGSATQRHSPASSGAGS
jgi:UDP-N-acetylmuramoyl-tripeptide--D-alanyl-D-alanine ligase